MKTVQRVALLFSLVVATLCSSCDDNNNTCPVKDDRHEVVTLTDSPTTTVVAMCVASGNCMQLCTETAMAHSSPDHSDVYSCKRVDADAGVDAGSSDGFAQVTLEIDYRVYAFCGI